MIGDADYEGDAVSGAVGLAMCYESASDFSARFPDIPKDFGLCRISDEQN